VLMLHPLVIRRERPAARQPAEQRRHARHAARATPGLSLHASAPCAAEASSASVASRESFRFV